MTLDEQRKWAWEQAFEWYRNSTNEFSPALVQKMANWLVEWLQGGEIKDVVARIDEVLGDQESLRSVSE